jgi:hypothetical protein
MNSELSSKTTTQFLTTPDVCACSMFAELRSITGVKRLIAISQDGRNVYFLEHEITEAVKKIDFGELSSFPYKDSSK